MGGVEGQVRDENLDAGAEARRRLALAQVRQYPDPALRMRAKEVESFDDALQTLVERMGVLMQEARGVGLAAPQVGILQRVFVYQPSEEDPVTALVNPRIRASSETRIVENEGCLSLGASAVVVPVERAETVTVEASAPRGEPFRIDAEGLAARVLQHELDHLDGILILDRTTPEERRAALARLRPQPVLGPIG